MSGCGLFTAPYSKVSPVTQEQLRQQFGQLVHDDTPMVRRQAATHMAKFVREMPAAIVVDEMIPMFQHLVQDDQDSVRLLAVEILISIAEVVPKEQQASHGVILTSLRSLIEDKSWRVRYMISDKFEKVRALERLGWVCGWLTCASRLPRLSTRRLCREIWSRPL